MKIDSILLSQQKHVPRVFEFPQNRTASKFDCLFMAETHQNTKCTKCTSESLDLWKKCRLSEKEVDSRFQRVLKISRIRFCFQQRQYAKNQGMTHIRFWDSNSILSHLEVFREFQKDSLYSPILIVGNPRFHHWIDENLTYAVAQSRIPTISIWEIMESFWNSSNLKMTQIRFWISKSNVSHTLQKIHFNHCFFNIWDFDRKRVEFVVIAGIVLEQLSISKSMPKKHILIIWECSLSFCLSCESGAPFQNIGELPSVSITCSQMLLIQVEEHDFVFKMIAKKSNIFHIIIANFQKRVIFDKIHGSSYDLSKLTRPWKFAMKILNGLDSFQLNGTILNFKKVILNKILGFFYSP